MRRRLLPWTLVVLAGLATVACALSACAGLGVSDGERTAVEQAATTVGGTIQTVTAATGNPLIAWLGTVANAGLTAGATWWARRRSKGDVEAKDREEFNREDGRSLIALFRAHPDLLALLLDLLKPVTPAGKPGEATAA